MAFSVAMKAPPPPSKHERMRCVRAMLSEAAKKKKEERDVRFRSWIERSREASRSFKRDCAEAQASDDGRVEAEWKTTGR